MSRYGRKASLVVALALLATPALAVTRVVDQDGQATATNCSASTAAYASIGAAVAAAADGDTIVICPGTAPYDEQVVIAKALTVKGFVKTNVVIRPTPMVANTTSLYSDGPIAAVIVVTDTNATLTNLVVDGGGADLESCSVNTVGIFYRNASGTVSNSTARNLRLAAGLEGCQAGIGIFAQSGGGGSSALTISGSSVHDYQKNGIVGNEVGTTIDVDTSLVSGDGPANGSIQNGIQIGFGATGTVTDNRVFDLIYSPCTFPYVPGGGCDTGASLGALIFDAGDGVLVSGNVIGNTQGGIYIGGNTGTRGADVLSNEIFSTHVFDGIALIGGNNNSVRGNTITSSDTSAVFLIGDDNSVASNRIQETPVGIWDYSGTGNTYPTAGGSTFFNVDTLIVAGTPLAQHSFATATATAMATATAARDRVRTAVRP